MNLGLDFVQAIADGIGACDALLVLMSKQWLTAKAPDGTRRIDDPNDHLRLEIATALERDVRVIPLLVRGAKMPSADELPAELAPLMRKQGIELSDDRWEFDVGRLIEVLEKILGKPAPPANGPNCARKTGRKITLANDCGRRRGVVSSRLALFGMYLDNASTDVNLPASEPPAPAYSDTDKQLQYADIGSVAATQQAALSAPALAGTWYNDAGVRYEITQQQNSLASQVFDMYGNLIATGVGTAGNAQMRVEYSYQIGGGGLLSGVVQNDNRHINFSYNDYVSGMTVTGQLHLNHYAGQ